MYSINRLLACYVVVLGAWVAQTFFSQIFVFFDSSLFEKLLSFPFAIFIAFLYLWMFQLRFDSVSQDFSRFGRFLQEIHRPCPNER